MPLRRTIGISLAFLMISSGAMAKTPEKAAGHRPHPAGVKTGEGEARTGWIRSSCADAQARSSARYSSRHYARARHRAARSGDNVADAGLDSARMTGGTQIGKAAWYSLVGGYTSSGERLDTVTPTAAHRSLPLASYAKVTSLDSGRSVIVKINDRGPRSRRFIIDLSPRAADEIDMKHMGIAAVMVEPVTLGAANQPTSIVAAVEGWGYEIAQ
jgi:rare lipoprotein A (peptidoglycan hydrolase)